MSKDIIVLAPNGRRQKVHCSPDTNVLQILEDVCEKQGFEAAEYELKHHNHVLDLTTTVRFSNLPNKATLEMVESAMKREEKNVTIGLLLEDGERRTAEFPPSTSLYDLITSLAPGELRSFQRPTILYMRQEVTGEPALRRKTLKQLGLISGRAILRLLNKAEEARQANVSTVYRKAQQDNTIKGTLESIQNQHQLQHEDVDKNDKQPLAKEDSPVPGPSGASDVKTDKILDPLKLIKEQKEKLRKHQNNYETEEEQAPKESKNYQIKPKEIPMDIESAGKSSTTHVSQEILERRLKIEDEVTFLGAQKAIAFTQPDNNEDVMDDLPDDFYELTVEEVRKLYNDLQQNRLVLESTPLLTATARQDIEKQTSQQRLASYKNVVVRIQFPDNIILQGIFDPSNTIKDVINFIKQHMKYPEKTFHIFTTPLKESLDPDITLLQAKFVPCVLMHFKWLEDDGLRPCLKEEIYSNTTSSDAASLLASKYRAPSRKKTDHPSDSKPSTSTNNSKIPKWYK